MVSVASVGRFLALWRVPEPRCRAILVIAQEHASDGILTYGDVQGREILGQLEPAFRTYVGDIMNQMAMFEDMGRGTCVVLDASLRAFKEHMGSQITEREWKRIRRRAGWYNDGDVIVVEQWSVFVPFRIRQAFLEFLGLPAEEHNTFTTLEDTAWPTEEMGLSGYDSTT